MVYVVFEVFTFFQYSCGSIRFCAGVTTWGTGFSKVSGVGIGSLSSSVREVWMTLHRWLGGVSFGAYFSSAKIGVMASLSTSAASSLVCFRNLLLHSMCRCGVFPLTYGRGFLQKGHLSISSERSLSFGCTPMLRAWFDL